MPRRTHPRPRAKHSREHVIATARKPPTRWARPWVCRCTYCLPSAHESWRARQERAWPRYEEVASG